MLLAEGDLGNAEFMTLLLEADGHQVQIARNGITALRLAQAEPPDVVLLEIRLLGMDGCELVRRLHDQATEKRPFCIAITGCGTEADRCRSQEAGIDIHMLKPMDSRFVRKVLKRFQEGIGRPCWHERFVHFVEKFDKERSTGIQDASVDIYIFVGSAVANLIIGLVLTYFGFAG